MIIVEKYKPVRYGRRNKQFWMSLVRCESPYHIGDRLRLVGAGNVKKGIGIHACDRCATISRNKSSEMRMLGRSRTGERSPSFGRRVSERTKQLIGLANKGKKVSTETRQKMSKARMGKKPSAEAVEKTRLKLIGRFVGSKSPRWNPNLTHEDRRRNRAESVYQLKIFRELVYTRDHFTCQITGDNRGGNLNAHHLYNWSDYPDKRYDVHNGITLRKDIHELFHQIYGVCNNTVYQFFEFCEYIYGVLNPEYVSDTL